MLQEFTFLISVCVRVCMLGWKHEDLRGRGRSSSMLNCHDIEFLANAGKDCTKQKIAGPTFWFQAIYIRWPSIHPRLVHTVATFLLEYQFKHCLADKPHLFTKNCCSK